nr:Dihydrofolate reductase [uncultured bacterium]
MAAADNDVIGNSKQTALPWHQATDMARVCQITKGHPVIMGRTTYETMGKPLPHRQNIIVTRKEGYTAEGCDVVHSLDEALTVAESNPEVFIIGGGEIYQLAMPKADRIYLTRVHARPEGDVFFTYDVAEWIETSREDYPADETNQYPYSFINLTRRK